MKIVLIGFMGSGKSKVGKVLAGRLHWPHHDTDDEIAREAGMSPGDLIRTKGEAAFRAIERAAVKRLSARDQCVISTGGGVPVDAGNLEALSRDAAVIWLKAKPETILRRVGNASSRPLIDPARPLDSIRERLAQREPLYAKAHHTVDSDVGTPETVAEKILSLVKVTPA